MSALAVALWIGVASAPPRHVDAGPPPAKVDIRCDDMVVDNRNNSAHCRGHVKADRRDTHLTCDQAEAVYDEDGKLSQFICTGHVVAIQGGKRATGDRGVYSERKRTLEMTGHAVLERGEDRLRGEPVVFYVDEDRVVAHQAALHGKANDLVIEHPDGGADAGADAGPDAGADGGAAERNR
jgi:lipopolysaccharide transport protein LptA